MHAGNGFEQAAKTAGLIYQAQEYAGKPKDMPDALKAHFPEGLAALNESFRKLLDATQPGEIVSTIAENDHSYRNNDVVSRVAMKLIEFSCSNIYFTIHGQLNQATLNHLLAPYIRRYL